MSEVRLRFAPSPTGYLHECGPLFVWRIYFFQREKGFPARNAL